MFGKTQEQWLKEGDTLYADERYQEALTAYDQALRLDPGNALYQANRAKVYRR